MFHSQGVSRWRLAWPVALALLSACDTRQPMRVEVLLDNQCELIEGAFMAVSEPDGQKASFDRGRAVLHTYSDAKISVRANDRYPAFRFESPKVQAAPSVTITTRCDDGERIDRTLDAMRGQFGNSR